MPRKKIENDINEEIKDVKPKRIRKTSTEKKSEEKTPITEEKTTKRKRTTKTKKKETNSVTTNRNEKIITAGDRECYCYVSVKLSSMKKDANIISLAMISPDGDTLYVENKEINIDFIDEKYKNTTIHCTKDHKPHLTGHTWVMSGTLEEIKAAILLWLDENYSNKGKFVQFVFDKNIYEFWNDGLNIEDKKRNEIKEKLMSKGGIILEFINKVYMNINIFEDNLKKRIIKTIINLIAFLSQLNLNILKNDNISSMVMDFIQQSINEENIEILKKIADSVCSTINSFQDSRLYELYGKI